MMYLGYVPIMLAFLVICCAVALITEFMRGCTEGRQCKLLDVRHMVLLLINILIAAAYIALEIRWEQVVSHSPDHRLDEVGWVILETGYFANLLYWMRAFRERYLCPRRKRG